MKGGKPVKAEVKERKYTGKPGVTEYMRQVTKEVLGKSWDKDTCSFAFDIMVEAIMRTILNEGGVTLPGFMKIEINHKPPARFFNGLKQQFDIRKGFNSIKFRFLPTYRARVKASMNWFYAPGTSEEVIKQIQDEANGIINIPDDDGGEG